jgi:hypothetical protein
MPSTNPEAALEEFERLAEAADVNVDTSTMDEESAEDLVEVRTLLTGAIEQGVLSVDEEGRAVLRTEAHGELRFRVPVGEDLMIMASARDDQRMSAMNRFVSSITGKDTRTIGKLTKREWKLAMRLAGFLSAD